MDNEKDVFIKEKFKKDELISKKADDVFNNFFGEEIKMKDEKIAQFKLKEKIINRKKILSAVAMLIVVFLGANVYAMTQGYENVFFMIRDFSSKGELSGKSEILKDQDITLSYESIQIAEGVEVQFSRFVVKDNKATLFMKVDQNGEISEEKRMTQIEVSNAEEDTQLTSMTIGSENTSTSFSKEIEIDFFDNSITNLKIKINAKKECLANIEIDLNNREIIVLSNSYEEIEKISEIELKEALSNYAILNSYEDMYDTISQYEVVPTKEEYMDSILVECAMDCIDTKEKDEVDVKYSLEKVNKAIQEMTGMALTEPLNTKNIFNYYDEENTRYNREVGDGEITALCLNIVDIYYEDGIYTVIYQYCYPNEYNYIENTIEELPVYESTLQFSLNEDYEYTKFSIANDLYNLRSEKIKEDTSNIEIPDEEIPNGEISNEETSIITGTEYLSLEGLSLEYRRSDAIRNYKDFNYDLDGDGNIDKVTIRKYRDYDGAERSEFELNGTKFCEDEFYSEIYIVDLNDEDNKLEVVILKTEATDYPFYEIYEKKNNDMELVSSIEGKDCIVDGKGNIEAKSYITYEMIPEVYDVKYNLNNPENVYQEYDFGEEEYSLKEGAIYYITKDLSNIDKVYGEAPLTLEEAEIYELKPGESFKVKEIIDYFKAIIEYNGEEYYLLSNKGNFAD